MRDHIEKTLRTCRVLMPTLAPVTRKAVSDEGVLFLRVPLKTAFILSYAYFVTSRRNVMIRRVAAQERARTRDKIAAPLALLAQQRAVAAIARTIAAQLALGSALAAQPGPLS